MLNSLVTVRAFPVSSRSALCPRARVRNVIITHEPGTVCLRGLSPPSPSPPSAPLSPLFLFLHLRLLICSFCSVLSPRGGDQQHEE